MLVISSSGLRGLRARVPVLPGSSGRRRRRRRTATTPAAARGPSPPSDSSEPSSRARRTSSESSAVVAVVGARRHEGLRRRRPPRRRRRRAPPSPSVPSSSESPCVVGVRAGRTCPSASEASASWPPLPALRLRCRAALARLPPWPLLAPCPVADAWSAWSLVVGRLGASASSGPRRPAWRRSSSRALLRGAAVFSGRLEQHHRRGRAGVGPVAVGWSASPGRAGVVRGGLERSSWPRPSSSRAAFFLGFSAALAVGGARGRGAAALAAFLAAVFFAAAFLAGALAAFLARSSWRRPSSPAATRLLGRVGRSGCVSGRRRRVGPGVASGSLVSVSVVVEHW